MAVLLLGIALVGLGLYRKNWMAFLSGSTTGMLESIDALAPAFHIGSGEKRP
jgi:hypothetical protein